MIGLERLGNQRVERFGWLCVSLLRAKSSLRPPQIEAPIPTPLARSAGLPDASDTSFRSPQGRGSRIDTRHRRRPRSASPVAHRVLDEESSPICQREAFAQPSEPIHTSKRERWSLPRSLGFSSVEASSDGCTSDERPIRGPIRRTAVQSGPDKRSTGTRQRSSRASRENANLKRTYGIL